MKFNCPHCTQRVSVTEEQRGMTLMCPACNGLVEIPKKPKPDYFWGYIYGLFWGYFAIRCLISGVIMLATPIPSQPDKLAEYISFSFFGFAFAAVLAWVSYRLFVYKISRTFIYILIAVHGLETALSLKPISIVIFVTLSCSMYEFIKKWDTSKKTSDTSLSEQPSS